MITEPTVMLPLRRMWERVDVTANESDMAYFYDLLNLGELLTKLVVSAMVASIDDREGDRYTLERNILRADGLGDWVTNMQSAFTGPPSTMMRREAQPHARQITQNTSRNNPSWQREAIALLDRACRGIDSGSPRVPPNVSMRWWFTTFVWLRNRTRGHGSPLPGTCAEAVEPLSMSLRLVTNKLTALRIPCAVIRRNMSGKYRVVSLTAIDASLEDLKRTRTYSYDDGVYYSFNGLCYTPLCTADIDLSDVQVANGSFRSTNEHVTYEVLSYITDNRQRIDGSNYLNAVAQLPTSETQGHPDLEVFGETFTNLPPQPSEYVVRSQLEQELGAVLTDERHPVVSLVGRGGIGKTSLALKVLRDLCDKGAYEFVIWFSARDIDLLEEGPKDVRPQVLTFEEIAKELQTLLTPYGVGGEDLPPEGFFARALSCRTKAGPILFVVDNFETVQSPIELYHTLDTHVRLPNKILITGRHHEFKADYPVEVAGMTRPEFDMLAHALAIRLGITPLVKSAYLDQLYEETGGHPYLVKVMLGEVANDREAGNVRRILATKDRMLDALFERSYATLPPGAQHVFLTLCNWRSLVPQLELEAALVRPHREYIDASNAINALERYSLVEVIRATSGVSFLRVPEAARVFGRKKLRVSPMKPVIDVDTAMLQTLGTVRASDVKSGFDRRVDQVVHNVARLAAQEKDVSEYMDVLEYIATGYPRAWLKIARLRFETPQLGSPTDALDAVERYLQEAPSDADAWRQLAAAARDLKNPDREMNALYRLAKLPDAELEDIANAAGCLSRQLKGTMKVGWDEKRLMANQLAHMMNAQRHNMNGTDFSRLAWLYLYLDERKNARDCVSQGLEIDSQNTHLLRLRDRLG